MYREKELVDPSSIRTSLLKLLRKLPISLHNAAFLPLEKKRSIVMMLAATALVAGLTLTLVAFGSINRSIIIGSGGTVNLPIGVGFYWDGNCTNPVSFIDWGDIQPGSTINMTIFVKNEGNQPLSLNIITENWTPVETTSYMVFSSNYIDQTINSQENIQITLSLATSPNIEGITSFSFDINVAVNPV